MRRFSIRPDGSRVAIEEVTWTAGRVVRVGRLSRGRTRVEVVDGIGATCIGATDHGLDVLAAWALALATAHAIRHDAADLHAASTTSLATAGASTHLATTTTLATTGTTTLATVATAVATSIATAAAGAIDGTADGAIDGAAAITTHAASLAAIAVGALHVGDADARRVEGGTLDQRTRRVTVHCLLRRDGAPGVHPVQGRAANAAGGAQQHRG